MKILVSLLIWLLISFPHTLTLAEDSSLIGKIQKIENSLVEIKTVYSRTLRTVSGRTGIASYERHGTGIIVDSSGIIVTNTHIIKDAPRILVGLSNGKVFEATVLFISEADFSFIKISSPYPLKAITWADSSEAQIGQPVIALGNSDYNHQSILGGQITSLIESMSSGNIELLELNINLYEGDSGGPILNEDGALLGLIMAKRKNQDRQSYAIASNKIRQEYLKFKQNMP